MYAFFQLHILNNPIAYEEIICQIKQNVSINNKLIRVEKEQNSEAYSQKYGLVIVNIENNSI